MNENENHFSIFPFDYIVECISILLKLAVMSEPTESLDKVLFK